MAVLRQQNWLNQQRVETSHLRSIESGAAADFDLLAGRIMAGEGALVVKGFNVVLTGAIGAAATSLKVNAAGGLLLHYLASENGTLYASPASATTEQLSTTNALVSGGFTASAVNYVGLDLRRSADDTTTDLVTFLDETTKLESNRTLGYRFIISTSDFSQADNILPLAKVTLDSGANVTAIEDARNLFFRLGSGGTTPNHYHTYPWAEGRNETTSTVLDNFVGGDKAITSMKGWMDAVMSTIWEAKGGRYWYSPTADRNVKLIRNSASTFTDGSNITWDGTNLLWKGLSIVFDSSNDGSVAPGVYKNTIADRTVAAAGYTDLLDGQCVYVDIDRTSNVAAAILSKAYISTLNATGATIPGSRYIVAWRIGSYVYSRDFPVSTTPTGYAAYTAIAGFQLTSTDAKAATTEITIAGNLASSVTSAVALTGFAHGTVLRLINMSNHSLTWKQHATNFILTGGVDFVAGLYDSLTVYFDGTRWIEVGRADV
jgi:hypothetical protein